MAAKRETFWWAVIVEGEIPDAYGPFRNYDVACSTADHWNSTNSDSEAYAWVVRMKNGPISA